MSTIIRGTSTDVTLVPASAAAQAVLLNNIGVHNLALLNGQLTASAASSALTIAIKTLAGSDPSSTDPVIVVFRNVTAGTGDYTTITITAATSLVVSSGSTLGVTSSTAFRLWVTGFNDGGTFRLGVVKCVDSNGSIFPLSNRIASSTAEGGAGAADSSLVIYTGTAVTSKAMSVLGFLEWSSSGLTAGTWTTTNLTTIQPFGYGIKLPGMLNQEVFYSATNTATTTSATYVSTGFSSSITPISAANMIDVSSFGPGYCTGAGASNGNWQMSRGTTANTNMIGSTVIMSNAAGVIAQSVVATTAIDFPNTTSSQSYAVQYSNNAGYTTAYGNALNCVIRLKEVVV